ncbi:unnamed protein product [Adineta steineri]|uniref:Cation-transporting P-type ATPase N-terminal domain-containing protein n=1 Tax=Adineta steineri TaxID=433720 RepID=A0A814NEU5_9BILA|nr:unnamed protein product [Adineta steineri]CAF0938273.1 unnamed protein product [Adineta steineri]CAF0965757.1 unnamed protein product [Adineta steineri]CAF0968278.1 unnamed protein product [Adineta steineri]CAF1082929.1 unnamed protein product [Adineta steineri]
MNGGYANGGNDDDRNDSTRIVSYRSAVSRDHSRPASRTKRKRIGNEIDLNDANADLYYDEHHISIEELVHRYDTDLKTGLTKIQAKQRLLDEGRNHIEPPHVSISKSCERFWLQPYIFFVSILSLLAILCFVAFAIQLNTRQDPTFENLYMLIVLIIFILLPSVFTFAVSHISANKLQYLRYQIKQVSNKKL